MASLKEFTAEEIKMIINTCYLFKKVEEKNKERNKRQREKGKICPYECRVPKNSKER